MAGVDVAEFDPRRMRDVLGHFASGITIVTAMSEGRPVGLTCQSFFSVSLEPPLVIFSAAKTSHSYPEIRKAKSFCINILAAGQEELSRRFARSGTDKWKGVRWRPGKTGSPLIEGVLAGIDCVSEAEHEAGDHYLCIGRVVDMETGADGEPLLYYKGAYAKLMHDLTNPSE